MRAVLVPLPSCRGRLSRPVLQCNIPKPVVAPGLPKPKPVAAGLANAVAVPVGCWPKPRPVLAVVVVPNPAGLEPNKPPVYNEKCTCNIRLCNIG